MKCNKICSRLGFAVLGAVIALSGAYLALLASGLGVTKTDSVAVNVHSGWQEISIAGVATFEVPSTCTLDPGAGNTYVVCPTVENPQPTPDMVFSSDGITLNVRRWEHLESPFWDHMIASMKIIQPVRNDITINIEK